MTVSKIRVETAASIGGDAISPDGGKFKFARDGGFHSEVKRRVGEYFRTSGVSPQDNVKMYVKSAAILLWFGASYLLLVFAATTWWQGALLAVSLALAGAGIGFCVQHDANHGAYSKVGFINRLMGMSLDVFGLSSYVWRWKHNVFHHTYANLSGADDDIDVGPVARLAPTQPRYRFHRLQQFYLWMLYGFLLLKWHVLDDFKNVAEARIAKNRFPRPDALSLAQMLGGKALFVCWTFILPLFFHRWWVVLLFNAGVWFSVGLILSVVFQLAHCVEEASFPDPPEDAEPLPGGWAAHQVLTTVNFARRNAVLTWYLGGLNYQIEHHLFPKICHVHYPRISKIVETVCNEFGLRYNAHDGLLAALSSHWRWLRRMGRPVSPAQMN